MAKKIRNNKSPHIINLMISVVLSLVVNFSYLVALNLNVYPGSEPRFGGRRPPMEHRADSLHRNDHHARNPHNEPPKEQIATQHDTITTAQPNVPDSIDSNVYIREQNIRARYDRFDPMRHYQKQYKMLMSYEFAYYMVLAFIMLTIATARMGKNKRSYHFLIRIALCLAVALLLYYVAPQMTWRGRIILTMQAHNLYNPMLMLKISIVAIVAIMYSKIYELLFQRQNMVIENEQLKNEVLVSQYTGLVNQINPHFFFNSLNSLSMLVRENQNDAAQTYINELSNTFRYIIQESKNNLTTLENELKFVESYKYLFEVRYAGKFFVNIDVDKEKLGMVMPSLSLQPLIENAVKHNTITKIRPLTINIKTENEHVIVSNHIVPKIDDSEIGTGIGLKNLSSRYQLLVNKPVVIENDGVTFIVKLPLSEEDKA